MSEEQGFERVRANAKGFAKQNGGYVAVAVLALVYTASALIQIGKSDKTVWTILADGATAMLLSVAVARLLSLQGILRGKQSSGYLATASLLAEVVRDAAPFVGKLDAWCKQKTAEALRELRERILLGGGLKYEECFDEDGVALPLPIREIPRELLPTDKKKRKMSAAERLVDARRQERLEAWEASEKLRRSCYDRAVATSIAPLVGSTLTGSRVRIEEPFDFGRDVTEYVVASTKSGLVSRVVCMCVFGYFGVDLVKDFSREELIYRALQVAVALAFGIVQMYLSYLYVVEERRGNDIKKIDYLQMFLSDARAGVIKTQKEEKTEMKEEEKHGENVRPEYTEGDRADA